MNFLQPPRQLHSSQNAFKLQNVFTAIKHNKKIAKEDGVQIDMKLEVETMFDFKAEVVSPLYSLDKAARNFIKKALSEYTKDTTEDHPVTVNSEALGAIRHLAADLNIELTDENTVA